VHYISGRAIHRASESYRGEGKTDAKDAAVIADQVRIRQDLHLLRTGDEAVTDLKVLTGRRMDLVADRTRTVNRLRAQLSSIFSGLERALDLTNTGPLTLLTGYQIPAALRRVGTKRMETWLRNRKVRKADQLAETAVQAAELQHTSLPGEKLIAQLVHTLAKEVMALNQQVAEGSSARWAVLRADAALRSRGLTNGIRNRWHALTVRCHRTSGIGRHERRSLRGSMLSIFGGGVRR
jgi:hypothetical protein